MDTVLAVVAHGDDELLGCGGTLIKHVDAGNQVHLLVMAEGVSARAVQGETMDWSDKIAERESAAVEAAKVMGLMPPVFLNFPNLQMANQLMLDIVKQVEKAIGHIKPGIIYTHHGGDLNSDHRVVHEAVMTACRPLSGLPVRALYAFEVPSSTEWSSAAIGPPFLPNRFVDISKQWSRKIDALAKYDIEMRDFPHPRSVEALDALARRYGSMCHRHMAEALMVLRQID